MPSLRACVVAATFAGGCSLGTAAFESRRDDVAPARPDAGDAGATVFAPPPQICAPVACRESLDTFCARFDGGCPMLSANDPDDVDAGVCKWLARESGPFFYIGPVTCASGDRGIVIHDDGELWFLFDTDGRTTMVFEASFAAPLVCAAGPGGRGFAPACCTKGATEIDCPFDAGPD